MATFANYPIKNILFVYQYYKYLCTQEEIEGVLSDCMNRKPFPIGVPYAKTTVPKTEAFVIKTTGITPSNLSNSSNPNSPNDSSNLNNPKNPNNSNNLNNLNNLNNSSNPNNPSNPNNLNNSNNPNNSSNPNNLNNPNNPNNSSNPNNPIKWPKVILLQFKTISLDNRGVKLITILMKKTFQWPRVIIIFQSKTIWLDTNKTVTNKTFSSRRAILFQFKTILVNSGVIRISFNTNKTFECFLKYSGITMFFRWKNSRNKRNYHKDK